MLCVSGQTSFKLLNFRSHPESGGLLDPNALVNACRARLASRVAGDALQVHFITVAVKINCIIDNSAVKKDCCSNVL